MTGSPSIRWKARDGGDRLRPRDRVDRAAVEALRAQRDLQTGRLRVPPPEASVAGVAAMATARTAPTRTRRKRMGSPTTRRAPRILLPAAVLYLPTKRRRALLGEGGEALLGVLAREQVAELLGLPLERARARG